MVDFCICRAEQIPLTIRQKGHAEKSTTVRRSHQHLVIDVIYDNEARQVLVSGDEDIAAQVFLCDMNGNILDYSAIINATFDVSEKTKDTLIIRIEAEDWMAGGEVSFN